MPARPILLFLAAALVFGQGCGGDAPTGPQPLPDAPVPAPLAAFVPGDSVGVRWTAPPVLVEFQVQTAVDSSFATPVIVSPWLTGNAHTVTGLRDGTSYHHRVRGRTAGGAASPWSLPVAAIQDASPPATTVRAWSAPLTALDFPVVVDGGDAGSGLDSTEIWVRDPAGGISLGATGHGGATWTYTAPGGGDYAFQSLGRDRVGNRQQLNPAGWVTARVPDPIRLTDAAGVVWDITHAVLAYHMAVEQWDYGFGVGTIPPIVDPRHLGPGDPGYPDADAPFLALAVIQGTETVAYPLGDLFNTEVADDRVGDTPVAVTY